MPSARPKKKRSTPARTRIRVVALWRKRWVRWTAVAIAVPTLALCLVATYYYISFARLIDARLHGERDRVLPRVYARPLELRRGQSMTDRQLIDRLNDLGYAQRARVEKPGEFSVAGGSVSILPRSAALKGKVVRVLFREADDGARSRPSRGGRRPSRRTTSSGSSWGRSRASASRSTRPC